MQDNGLPIRFVGYVPSNITNLLTANCGIENVPTNQIESILKEALNYRKNMVVTSNVNKIFQLLRSFDLSNVGNRHIVELSAQIFLGSGANIDQDKMDQILTKLRRPEVRTQTIVNDLQLTFKVLSQIPENLKNTRFIAFVCQVMATRSANEALIWLPSMTAQEELELQTRIASLFIELETNFEELEPYFTDMPSLDHRLLFMDDVRKLPKEERTDILVNTMPFIEFFKQVKDLSGILKAVAKIPSSLRGQAVDKAVVLLQQNNQSPNLYQYVERILSTIGNSQSNTGFEQPIERRINIQSLKEDDFVDLRYERSAPQRYKSSAPKPTQTIRHPSYDDFSGRERLMRKIFSNSEFEYLIKPFGHLEPETRGDIYYCTQKIVRELLENRIQDHKDEYLNLDEVIGLMHNLEVNFTNDNRLRYINRVLESGLKIKSFPEMIKALMDKKSSLKL